EDADEAGAHLARHLGGGEHRQRDDGQRDVAQPLGHRFGGPDVADGGEPAQLHGEDGDEHRGQPEVRYGQAERDDRQQGAVGRAGTGGRGGGRGVGVGKARAPAPDGRPPREGDAVGGGGEGGGEG